MSEHEEALQKAQEARAKRDAATTKAERQRWARRSRRWSRRARGIQEQITRERHMEPVPAPTPEAEPSISIDDLVRESRVTGVSDSIKDQLRLLGEGKITKEQFTERKAAIEAAHLAWAEGSEARGWEASPEERAAAEDIVREVKVQQTEAYVGEVLRAEVEGKITHEQSVQLIKKKGEEHLEFMEAVEAGETVVPAGLKLTSKYEFVEPVVPTEIPMGDLGRLGEEPSASVAEGLVHPDQERVISPITQVFDLGRPDKESALEPIVEGDVPDTTEVVEHLGIEISLEQFEADFPADVQVKGAAMPYEGIALPDPSDFTGIPGPAAGPAPGSISELAQETIQDILDVEITMPIPGPAAGPTPGSLGEILQEKVEGVLEAEESFFKDLTKPFVLASGEQAKYASEFAMQGRVVEGTLAYISSLALGAVPVAFDVITTPIRPGLTVESIESVAKIALDWDPEVEKQAAELKKKIGEQDIISSMYKSDVIVLEQEYLKEQRKADIVFSDPSKYTPESFKAFEKDWARYEAETLQSLAKAETGKMEYSEWKAEAESQLLYLEGYSPRKAVIESILSDPVRAVTYVGTGIAAGYVTGKIMGEVMARGKKAIFDWEMGKYTEADWFPVETEMGMQYPHTEIKQPDWWRAKAEKVIIEDVTSHAKFDDLGIDDAVKWGKELNPPWGTTEGGPTLMPRGTHRGLPWKPPEMLRKFRQTGEGLQIVDYVDPRYAVETTIQRLVREPSPFSVPVTTPGIRTLFDASKLQLVPSIAPSIAGGLLGGVQAITDIGEKPAPITPEAPSISTSIDLDSLATITPILKVGEIETKAQIDLDQILVQKLDIAQIPVQDIDLVQLPDLDQIQIIEDVSLQDIIQTPIQDIDISQILDVDQVPIQITEPIEVQITEPVQIQDIDQIQLQVPDQTQVQITAPVQIPVPLPTLFTMPKPPSLGLPFFLRGRKPTPRERRVRVFDHLGWEERRYPVSSIEDLIGGRRGRAPRRPSRRGPVDPVDFLLGGAPKSRRRKTKPRKKKAKPRRSKTKKGRKKG